MYFGMFGDFANVTFSCHNASFGQKGLKNKTAWVLWQKGPSNANHSFVKDAVIWIHFGALPLAKKKIFHVKFNLDGMKEVGKSI